MRWNDDWSKATKKAYNDAKREFAKKNPRSNEAKQGKQSSKRQKLWEEFQRKTKELDKQMAAGDDDEE